MPRLGGHGILGADWICCMGAFAVLLVGCFDLKKAQISSDTGEDPPETCSECTELYCQSATEMCFQDPVCKVRQQCIDRCRQNGSTKNQCDVYCLKDEFYFGLHTDVSVCQGERCPDLCERPCGGFTYGQIDCDSCIQKYCCEEALSCAGNKDCLDVHQCRSLCGPGDYACATDCSSHFFIDAETEIFDYQICLQSNCHHECGIGKAWSCLGKTNSIQADAEREITLRLTLLSLQGEPIPDVFVAACSILDSSCMEPIVSVHSDENGLGTLTYKSPGRVWFKLAKAGYLNTVLEYPVLNASPHPMACTLLRREDLVTITEIMGAVLEDGRAHFFITLMDCAMRWARDLIPSVLDVEGETVFVFRNGSPVFSPNYTDSSGQAGIGNVPPGRVLLQASVVGSENDPVLQQEINGRPDTLHHIILWPQ